MTLYCRSGLANLLYSMEQFRAFSGEETVVKELEEKTGSYLKELCDKYGEVVKFL